MMPTARRTSMNIRRAIRRGCTRTFAGLLVGAATAASAGAQVSVEQFEIFFRLTPGATRLTTQAFRVNNAGNSAAQVTVTAQDWDRSATGENRYYSLGQLPASCRHAVQVFPSVLQLDAHSSQDVRVTVDSAASVAAGCHTILFVESPADRTLSRGTALVYSLRYGVKVYVEREGTLASEIENIEVVVAADPNAAADARDLVLTVRNTGARQAVSKGTLEIRRADNSVAAKVDIAEFPSLPGAVRTVRLQLPKLARGQYVLLATLDFGGAELIAGQTELEVP